MVPSYIALHESGELRRRAERALARLAACDLCPRRCGVDRLAGQQGCCQIGRRAKISSVGPHFGEEAPLVGQRGSGTIFFAGCNLECAFCQNSELSHRCLGRRVDAEALAASMLAVQEMGCHNLNLVTPTHVTAQLLEALAIAVAEGLRLPIVYNCGGYESLETLALLRGVVDIYMPDLKYSDAATGARYSGVADYPQVARAALKEMHRQVGVLTLDRRGVAERGLLVRHLVLPAGRAGTGEAMRFLARELSPDTYVNVMSQYRPAGSVFGDPDLGRPLTSGEYLEAVELARQAGLTRLDR